MGWLEDNKNRIANTCGSFLINMLMGWILMGLCIGLMCFSLILKTAVQKEKKVLSEQHTIIGGQHERTNYVK